MSFLPPGFSVRVFSISGCLLALSACGKIAENGEMAAGATTVITVAAEAKPWNDTISALGTVQARESITVTAKVSEVVQQVHFESGEEVEAGARLVTLSGNQQQAALAAAEATAAEAESAYKRHLELVEQQLISRSTLDTQRALHESAQARVEQMRADLGDRIIRAPFAGVLGIRRISQGALITPGTPIVTLDDISRVYVDFPVPELQLAQLVPGQIVSGASAAWPGQVFSGTVRVIDARVDEASRAVMVRADFANPGHKLRPGMLVQVLALRPTRQALVLPELALVQIGRETFVWKVDEDQRVERVQVSVGQRQGGQVEIVSGVARGDKIVVEGTGKLYPGAHVREPVESGGD